MNPDYTLCLQCVPGSLLLANGKCSDENNLFVFDGTGIRETGNYIGNDGDVVLPWCAYAIYIQTGGSWAPVCVLYKSDPYVSKYFTTPPPMATFGHDDCDDYDYVNKECKSNGCNDISATYFTDLKYCIKSDCQLKGCATTDSTNAFGQCLSCQPGYRLFDGKCWIKPRLTEVTSCIDYDD